MAQPGTLKELSVALQAFAEERDWEQFHSPKNLAMALTVEAAELQEIFQWLTTQESRSLTEAQRKRVKEELGDVMNYLTRLADTVEVDLVHAATDKIAENEKKYPATEVRGKADKYTAYQRKSKK